MSPLSQSLPVSLDGLDAALARSIEEIAAKRSEPLTATDLHELIEAHEFGKAAMAGDDPTAEDEVGVLERSIVVGNVVLRSPTIAARIILGNADGWAVPAEWAAEPHLWLRVLAAYVLAHAYDRDVLALLADRDQAVTLIQEWATALVCDQRELSRAVAKLTNGAYPDVETVEKKKRPVRWGRLLLRLCRAAPGTTPDYWLYREPDALACWVLKAEDWRQRKEAEAASRSAGSPLPPAGDDPRLEAVAKWRELEKRLTDG